MEKLFSHLLIAVLSAWLLAVGCTDSTIRIDLGSGGGDNGGATQPDGPEALVTFSASVESRNLTRALTPVRKNVQAEIFAYAASQSPSDASPRAQGAYISQTPGAMHGADGFQMYLPAGSYDFYAVSDNTPFAAPTFSGGKSEPLANGVDYLWWGGTGEQVSSSQAGVPIVFQHRSTQVVFELAAGEGVTVSELALAHIYPPVDGARMDLATGVIPPAASYDSAISKMGVSGLVAQYTMLPVRSDQPLSVSFSVRIDGETLPRTYDVAVPLPDGVLAAGDSYRFKAVIQGERITFPSVSVTNWVDVDETGKPLYPSEL